MENHHLRRVREAARAYKEFGWAPLPVAHRDKYPANRQGLPLDGWKKYRWRDDNDFNDKADNIGIRFDDDVDIDLDTMEARQLAACILPATATYGRESAPQSHWIYKAEAEFCQFSFNDEMIVEIRTGGAQSVVPPSIHEAGEAIEWDGDWREDIAEVDGDYLTSRVRVLAAACLVCKGWPGKGSRDILADAMTAIFVKAGIDLEDAQNLILNIARVAGDDEVKKRRKKVKGKQHGIPAMKKIIGDKAGQQVLEWLGVSGDVIVFDEPVDLFAVTDAPVLDLSIVPPVITKRAYDIAERAGCNIENALIPGIIALGAAAGRNVLIQPKAKDKSWTEPATLYGGIVQPSGALKSPPANEIVTPLKDRHFQRIAEWEIDCASTKADEAKPEPPQPLFATNTTIEALVRDLSRSTGLLYFPGELAGLLKGANQYKKQGNDVELIMEIYDGYASSTRRKVTANIDIKRACLGLYGTIQPEIAAAYLVTEENSQSGMMARFGLLVYPEPIAADILDRDVDEDARAAYANLVDGLINTFVDSDWEHPCIFTLANAQRFTDWVNRERRANLTRDGEYGVHCAKHIGLAARLSLVFHLAQLQIDVPSVREPDGLPACRVRNLAGQMIVSDDTVVSALAFIEYLRGHLARIYGLSDHEGRGAKQGKSLAKLILEHPEWDSVTLSQVRKHERRHLRSAEDVEAAFRFLDASEWGRYNERDQSKSARPAQRFVINAKVHDLEKPRSAVDRPGE